MGQELFGGSGGQDPFGGAAGQELFGGSGGQDPFGGAAGQELFGGSGGQDLFGGVPGGDPFADAFETVEVSDEFDAAPPSPPASTVPSSHAPAVPFASSHDDPPLAAVDPAVSPAFGYSLSGTAAPSPARHEGAPSSVPPRSSAAGGPQKSSSTTKPKRSRAAGSGPLALLLKQAVATLGPLLAGGAQLVLLVGFLTVSVLWARGGALGDLWEGKALAVVLGNEVAGIEAEARLRIEGVLVTRYPTPRLPNLIIVSGQVRNISPESLPGVYIEARLGAGPGRAAWGGGPPGGLELLAAADEGAALAWNERAPRDGTLGPEQAIPFAVVFPSGVDGARASLRAKVVAPPVPVAAPGARPEAITPPALRSHRLRKGVEGRASALEGARPEDTKLDAKRPSERKKMSKPAGAKDLRRRRAPAASSSAGTP